MLAPEFPKHASELRPDLLTRALSERYPEVEVADVRVVEEAHCDTGSASTAARAGARGRLAGLPSDGDMGLRAGLDDLSNRELR